MRIFKQVLHPPRFLSRLPPEMLHNLPVLPNQHQFLQRRNPAVALKFLGPVNAIVGGWSLNGIYTYQSGLPLTVKYNGDVFGSGTDNARPDLVCNPNQSSDGRNVDQPFFTTSCFVRQSPIRYGTAGRSTVIGPVIQNIDIGVLKNNRITERFTTQFRAEFFNFPNHPQWNPPNRFIDQAAFGLINSARDPRIIQLGLKLNF